VHQHERALPDRQQPGGINGWIGRAQIYGRLIALDE